MIKNAQNGIAPVMIDLEGALLSSEEKKLLEHPLVGGVIFFTRNYAYTEQITDLVKQIRQAAHKDVLIAVDHEGGRVQRFRPEFTELPAIAHLGDIYNSDKHTALQKAKQHGWLMAAEVRSVGIDFSFAPVLDLDYGVSSVIGDRSFHADPKCVAELAAAYISGMREAGMASTGKHFPGHGAVRADSHLEIPVDSRSKKEIFAKDLQPFASLISEGMDAVMPAHVIYSEIDNNPAGFSRVWLQDILRNKLQFEGVIFSDDLTMEGASVVGGFVERAEAALEAGCDMILVCNNRDGVIEILDQLKVKPSQESGHRLTRMKGQPYMNRSALLDSQLWEGAVNDVTMIA
jgi:beta-N-acetylhexosaminidase